MGHMKYRYERATYAFLFQSSYPTLVGGSGICCALVGCVLPMLLYLVAEFTSDRSLFARTCHAIKSG